MVLPPLVSKVRVYWFTVHLALMVIFSAGMVAGMAGVHPAKV